MKRLKLYTQKVKGLTAIDMVTLGLVTAAFVLVLAVSISYTKARYFTPLSKIEVPVATTKDTYAPGELIEGLFFGEVRYGGEVKYVRQLVCPNYSEFIPDINTGKLFVQGSGVPRKLEGHRSPVGYSSQNVPLDVNCTIQFRNIYCVPYLFGCVKREYAYYTQTFTFKKAEVGATNTQNQTAQFTNPETGSSYSLPKQSNSSSSVAKGGTTNNVTNSTTNNTNTDEQLDTPEPGLVQSVINGVDNIVKGLF